MMRALCLLTKDHPTSPQYIYIHTAMQDIITALQTGCAPRLEYLNLSSTGSEFEEVNEMARLWKKKLREDGHCPHLRDSGSLWSIIIIL